MVYFAGIIIRSGGRVLGGQPGTVAAALPESVTNVKKGHDRKNDHTSDAARWAAKGRQGKKQKTSSSDLRARASRKPGAHTAQRKKD